MMFDILQRGKRCTCEFFSDNISSGLGPLQNWLNLIDTILLIKFGFPRELFRDLLLLIKNSDVFDFLSIN